jgi:hypothetical protein
MRLGRYGLVVLIAAVASVGSSANAQDVPEEEPIESAVPDAQPVEQEAEGGAEAEPPASAAPGASRAAPAGDPIWEAFDAAFAALARGDKANAKTQLEAIAREHATHPAASAATDVLSKWSDGKRLPVDDSFFDDDPHQPEKPTKGARAELALYQTIHGIAVGIEVCIVIECDEATAVVLLPLVGAGAGLVGALSFSGDGITPGHRSLINSGTSWGAFNGAMMLGIADVDDAQVAGLTLLAGQGLGIAAGEVLWHTLSPKQGHVALANSAGIWSGVLTLLTFGATDADLEADAALGTILAAVDAGLVIGGVVSSRYPMSRSRSLIIDSGGVLGYLGGFGTAVLIAGDPDQQLAFGSALGGVVLGLGAATFFTRDWDDKPGSDDTTTRAMLMPVRGGAIAGLAFDLD